MTVKLNLTINEELVAKSKRYAAKRKTTVSKLVQELLNDHITSSEKKVTKKKSFVEKYAGTLNIRIPDIDKVKDEYLKKKYGY